MDILAHIKEALANLLSAKLRSFLAILGILVGTGSVVALISSSQLASAHALEQFKKLGTNMLSMSLETQGQPSPNSLTFTVKDIPKLKKASDEIDIIAPYIVLYEPISLYGKSLNGSVLGVTPDIKTVIKLSTERGRFISYLDKSSLFCVIGDKIAQKIRESGVRDPLGQQIQIGNRFLTIIGVLQPWKPNMFLYEDLDKGIIVPLETAYLLGKHAQIDDMLFRLVKDPDLSSVQSALTTKVKELFPDKRPAFRSPEQVIDVMSKQQSTFTWLLSSIGGISLLVGGIGVMNIMLVSVIERRQEIGVRMAIGARSVDIRRMFLTESVILTLLGGVLGIFVGTGASLILVWVTGWAYHFYVIPPLLGFVVSVIVGILSGFYPAHAASQLDPIQTLQSE